MKKEDIPQDDGALNKLTKEVVYAVDSSGNYTTELSTGWWKLQPLMLPRYWTRIENARQKVLNNGKPYIISEQHRHTHFLLIPGLEMDDQNI